MPLEHRVFQRGFKVDPIDRSDTGVYLSTARLA